MMRHMSSGKAALRKSFLLAIYVFITEQLAGIPNLC
jgi:hypothetical protein